MHAHRLMAVTSLAQRVISLRSLRFARCASPAALLTSAPRSFLLLMIALQISASKPSEAIRALLERMEQELAPAVPAAAVSWPATMSKEEANKKFAHALFLIKDGSYQFAHSPASRGGEQVDLVLNKRGSSTHKSYTTATTFDDEVQGVIYRALAPHTFTVASQPAVVAIAPQQPDADTSHVSVRVGRLEPFIQKIADVIANGAAAPRLAAAPRPEVAPWLADAVRPACLAATRLATSARVPTESPPAAAQLG